MADVGDKGKYKKKIRKVFHKPDREFETFLPDTMRAPVIQVLGKPPSDVKGTSGNSNSYEHPHPHVWEKRNPNHRYHDEWDKRGSLGGMTAGSGQRVNEGNRNSLFGGDSGRPPGRGEDSEEASQTGVLTPTPVILSRARSSSEQRSTSPNPTAATARKDSAPVVNSSNAPTSQQQYHIAPKPLMMEASLTPERTMKGPLRLLDDSLNLCDDLGPYLLDHSNFLVVAVMGLQGVGKSCLASLLVDPSINIHKSRTCVFRPESLEQVMSACHGTNGVEVYITTERLIVLDCQPLLSSSIMDRLITQEKKYSSDYNSTENLMEVESLQVLTFAMSISHVVMLVQDVATDPTLIRLLQTCEMMKPSTSSSTTTTSTSSSSSSSSPANTSTPEDTQQYFPHVVFVHNRAPLHHFTPATLKRLQSIYQESFIGSCLESESRIGVCNSLTYTPLAQTSCGSLVNLFLIPDLNQKDHSPVVSFAETVKEMRRQVLSLRRLPLTHLTLTEKSWYQYVCRTWDSVRKWSLFMEYSRLLP